MPAARSFEGRATNTGVEYFEDLSVGDTREFGSYTFEEAEIVEFGERFDPQPFHTDPEAARESMFGGLVASGWHTAAATMRLLVEHVFADSAAMGAVGVDDLRWTDPVRPGDTVSVRTVVAEKADWKPGVGLVHSDTTVTADDGREVMTMTGLVLFERRE